MAGDAANIVLGAVIERVITPVVDSIGRHLGYLFCYKSNIKNLEEKVDRLEKSRNDANKFFKEQIRNNEEPVESSKWWQGEVEKVIKDAKEVEEATTKLKGCLNLKGRYVQSRKSTKLLVKIQTLQNKAPEGITTNITILPAGSLTGALANNACEGYKTRMQTLDEVMKALENHAISIIGICGPGGVGKTTMVHEVRERARTQNLFDEVAMTTVSQNHDLFKIQGDLAEMLGLKSIKEENNAIGRADQLHKRLTSGNKVLIILDDVWSNIKLTDVGIPVGSGLTECKVVITSRQEGVCTDIQKNIEVRVLAKPEARALFRKAAGQCVEMNNLENISNDIADKCGGLPIALLTLSRALSNKDVRAWEDAHTRLREGDSISIHGMEKEVYRSIKMSYDFLATEKQQEAQSLLLLCCQHPEDAEIKVEMLARYCLSLELFKGVNEVVRARNRVYSLIEHLKSRFLLQAVGVNDDKEVGADDDKDREWRGQVVKVHDVIRDVCLSIVSRHEADRDRVYMRYMEKETIYDYKLGNCEVNDPKIKLLILAPLAPHHKTLRILQPMEELRVLEKFPADGLSPGPFFFQFLTNLRMLSFEGRLIRPDIVSELSMLTKLEILSFFDSYIESFPCKIGQLRNLKVLDLRCKDWHDGLAPFPSGILPGLTKLEVLYMGRYCFAEKNYSSNGAVNGGVRETRISELDSLTNLIALQIFVLDPMRLLDLKHLHFEKLERFYFGSGGYSGGHFRSFCPLAMKTLQLKTIGIKWVLEDKIQSIVRRTVDLCFGDIRDWTDPVIIEKFMSLRRLDMRRCNQLEYIIHDGDSVDNATQSGEGPSSSSSVFNNLEILRIGDMQNLKELCHNGHLPEGSLYKLRELNLWSLPIMRHLWVGPTYARCFRNLRKVEILNCEAIKSIFTHSAAQCLVQLQQITVKDCSMLKGIVSKGGEGTTTGREAEITDEPNNLLIHFPKLKYVTIEGSHDLRGFYNLDDCRGQPLFNPSVMIPTLNYITVAGLNMVKQIVGGRMVDVCKFAGSEWLQNLERVLVEGCDSLDSVFDFEWQQVKGENTQVVILGKLEKMDLISLPNLTHVFRCRMKDISIPELQAIHVEECASLVNRLLPKEIRVFQNLKTLRVEDCGSMTYLIPSSMVHMLVNLEDLTVQSCEGMKEVVCKMKREDCGELEKKIIVAGGEMKEEARDHQVLKFPRLESVCLRNLTNLRGFYGVDDDDDDDGRLQTLFNPLVMLPSIVKLEFWGMHQLKRIVGGEMLYILSFASSYCLNNLERLVVRGCDSLESVFDFEGKQSMGENVHVVTLGKLEKVMLSRLPNLTHIFCGRIHDVSTPELRSIHVHKCDSLVSFAASSSLKLLQNLKHVRLTNCKAIKAVVDFDGFEVTREDGQAVLSKLETIYLEQLPNLEHICRRVPKEINGFQNLRSLFVYRCHSLGYLFTSTMAHMLVNLKSLSVWDCKSLKEVIKMNEDCGENKIVFHSLRDIGLLSLQNLSSFCSTKLQEFGFPSLDQVMILECDAMKTFCCGHVTAEKLQGVYIGFDNSSSTHEDDDGDDGDDNENDNDDYEYEDDDGDHHLGGESKVGDEDADGKVVWKTDVNETVRHFNARVNRMKSDLKEDGVDDDDADDDDDDDDGETKEELDDDDVGDKHGKDADDIHVPEEGVDNEHDQCDNKGTFRQLETASVAPLVISSTYASVETPVLSSVPPVTGDNKELAYSSSSPGLGKAAMPPRIVSFHSSTSTQQSVNLSKAEEVLSNSPDPTEFSPCSHEGDDPLQEAVIMATRPSSMVTIQPHSLQTRTANELYDFNDRTGERVSKAIRVGRSCLDEVAQNESGSTSKLAPHTAGQAEEADVSVALDLWKGRTVTRGEKDLLEAVEKHFPGTFDGVNFHNEAIWEFAVSTYCCYLSKFLAASVTDLSGNEVAHLRGMLLDLETFNFKVNWALDRLEKVEKLRFGSPFPQELADIERHRAPLLAKVEHLEADLALAKEELGNLDVLRETKRKMLLDEFGSDGLDLLESSLGWDLLPSYH